MRSHPVIIQAGNALLIAWTHEKDGQSTIAYKKITPREIE